MAVEKSVSAPVAEPGETVTYTIWYNNTGDGNAKAVWVNDTLPAGMDYVSANPAPSSISGQDLTWYFGNVAHNTVNSITLTARMNALPADGEVLINTASMVYHDALKRLIGTSTDSASVTCNRPIISVEKTVNAATASPGDTVVYTIYYNNTGSVTAGSVWINDTLPVGLTYVSATPAPDTVSGQDIFWHLTNVAPGAHSITVTVTVDSDATGTLTNWAYLDYASRYGIDMGSSSDSAVVEIPEMQQLGIPMLGILMIIIIFNNQKKKNKRKERGV
jgi:uncharacterized repeat protein (TIGR01451 family)